MWTRLFFFLLFVSLVVVQAKKAGKAEVVAESGSGCENDNEGEDKKDTDEDTQGGEGNDEEETESGQSKEENEDEGSNGEKGDESENKTFVCNLQYKRIGCYSSKEEKDGSSLSLFLMSDKDMGTSAKKGSVPTMKRFNRELAKFACTCANEALTSGNAIFGLQNFGECWSGPDDSLYDKQGPSNNCVTFDFLNCEPPNEICAGKENANFMYYIDTPEHNKTPDEVSEELRQEEVEKHNVAKKKRKKKRGKKTKHWMSHKYEDIR